MHSLVGTELVGFWLPIIYWKAVRPRIIFQVGFLLFIIIFFSPLIVPRHWFEVVSYWWWDFWLILTIMNYLLENEWPYRFILDYFNVWYNHTAFRICFFIDDIYFIAIYINGWCLTGKIVDWLSDYVNIVSPYLLTISPKSFLL